MSFSEVIIHLHIECFSGCVFMFVSQLTGVITLKKKSRLNPEAQVGSPGFSLSSHAVKTDLFCYIFLFILLRHTESEVAERKK